MQLQHYQALELTKLLELEITPSRTGILTLETKVNFWEKQRKGTLVIYQSLWSQRETGFSIK